METTADLVRYSLQIAAIVIVASAAARLVRLPSAAARLAFWRVVIGACLLLPLLSVALPRSMPGLRSPAIASFVSEASVPAWTGSTWLDLIPLLLVAGALLRVFWVAAGLLRLRWLRRTSLPIEADPEIEDLRRELAPGAICRSHSSIRQPITFGWRRPIVLLPVSLTALSAPARRAIVCHELLHVARRDWVWRLGEELICCAFWFHPAMRGALGQVDLSREQAVDEAVIERTSSRREYMSALLSFADASAPAALALPFGRYRHLERRLRNLSAGASRAGGRFDVRLLALSLLVAVSAITVAGASPQDTSKGPVRLGPGVTPPKVVREVKPQYTDEAKKKGVQGEVLMDIVVKKDGSVGETTVTKSLPDLDEQAIIAARQWKFEPGRVKGEAVEVLVSLQFTFTLK